MMCWSSTASSSSEETNAGSGSASPSCAASSQPRMLLNGVRSSWATSLTMALRCASSRARCADMSLNAAASRPTSSSPETGTDAGSSPSRIRCAAPVNACSGRTSRVPAKTEAPTVRASTSAAAPAILALFAGERSKPGRVAPPSSPMKRRAGEATYELSCSLRAVPTQEAMARSFSPVRSGPVTDGGASCGAPGAGTGCGATGPGSAGTATGTGSPHDRSLLSRTPSRPWRFRQASASPVSASSAFRSDRVGASRAARSQRVPWARSGSLPTTCTRGRPLAPTTTSEAIPARFRQATLSSAFRRSAELSAADSRNGPTARGSIRSAAAPWPSAPRAARTVSTDNGSTTADACGGRAGACAAVAESASACRLCVVSATRRPDSRANSRTVASTPSHVGLRAAYSSRVS